MDSAGNIIVIGRQYGSGGRKLGKLLATDLQIPYYDKELLHEAASTLGIRPELFERADECRRSKFASMLSANYGATSYFTSGAMHEGTLYQMQSDVIRMLLEKGPCVIVGRTADYIGRDLPHLVSLFLHADKDVRIRRSMERMPEMSEEDISVWLDRQDTQRRSYYNYYTGRKWGHADNYDLCINTSNLDVRQTADIVKLFINNRNSFAYQ